MNRILLPGLPDVFSQRRTSRARCFVGSSAAAPFKKDPLIMKRSERSAIRGRRNDEHRINKTDILAVIAVTGVFSFCFFRILYGAGYVDETFYYTFVQRLLNGDRWLVDEWFVSQLSSPLDVIPYKIAVWFCGGTEGIILFLRFFYLSCRIPIACMLWIKLRKYGLWGLLGELIYLTTIDFGGPTFSYYTMPLDGLMVVAALLFLSDNQTPLTLVFTGFVFACLVLTQPFSVLLYVSYTLFVFCRRYLRIPYRSSCKNKGTDEDQLPVYFTLKGWLLFSFGCFICAIPYVVFLFINSDFRLMIKTIPEILNNTDYNLLHDFGGHPRLIRKALGFIDNIGLPVFLASVLFLAVIWIRLRNQERRTNDLVFRFVFFLFGSVISAIMLFSLIRKYQRLGTISWIVYAPFQLIAPMFYLLCGKRDKTSFWLMITGWLFSIAVDSSSKVLIGYGGLLCQISLWISLAVLIKELRTGFREYKKTDNRVSHFYSGIIALASASVILFVSGWQATYIRTQFFYPATENMNEYNRLGSFSSTIEKGPLKGIKTLPRINRTLSSLISDIDRISTDPSKPLYILGKGHVLYLHADVRYACYSTWFEEDWYDRQVRYWNMLPENTPGTVYIPFYDISSYNKKKEDVIDKYLTELNTLFDYDMEKGEAGYILTINARK